MPELIANTPSPRILIVDDDRVQLNVLAELLKSEYQIRTAASGTAALQSLEGEHCLPDLILLDVTMPGMDGFSVCRKLQANDVTHHIPVIFLTVEQQVGSEAQGLAAGAVDYIKKPINPKLIKARIETHLRLKNSYAQQALFSAVNPEQNAEEQLDCLANLDPISGLPNRYYLKDRWSQVLDAALKQPYKTALLVINVDLFSHINAVLGNHLGDCLLKQVAQMLTSHVGDEHIVSRLNADEFVIILQQLDDTENAITLAGEIVQLFKCPILLEQNEIFLGVSIGIARFPGDGEEIDMLLKHATIAMHHAKADGRGTYQDYQGVTSKKLGRCRPIEMNLSNALSEQQFQLYFQPIIDLNTQKVIGAEALVRWHRRGQSIIGPTDFIPLAQTAGLMASIDDWVLQTACGVAIRDLLDHQASFRLSVNFSRQQLSQIDMPERLLDILSDTGFPTDILTVEISETLLTEPTQTIIKHLDYLKSLGIRLSIDDFSGGQMSFNSIQHGLVNEIKIDCSLLKSARFSEDSKRLLEKSVQAAHQQPISVVIKGVETTQQYQLLQKHAYPFAQGFLFSQPLPVDDFEKFLRRSGVYALM